MNDLADKTKDGPETPLPTAVTPVRVRIVFFLPFVSGGMLLCVSLLYALRPDALAAVTVLPAWLWLFPGLWLALRAWKKSSRHIRKFRAAIAAGWLLFMVFGVDEPRSLARLLTAVRPVPEGRRAIRVVSLNCSVSPVEAAAEVLSLNPDIVLLQESPSEKDLVMLSQRLYGERGGVARGIDVAILARGTLSVRAIPNANAGNYAATRVAFDDGASIEVISLHLEPGVARLDLWSPGCWIEQTRVRRLQRRQLRPIAEYAAGVAEGVPVIVGGDFNAAQGDAIFRSFGPNLRDGFDAAGRGWANTILNGFPVLRIDQVWFSNHFHVKSVTSRKTEHSDHRMVVCDVAL